MVQHCGITKAHCLFLCHYRLEQNKINMKRDEVTKLSHRHFCQQQQPKGREGRRCDVQEEASQQGVEGCVVNIGRGLRKVWSLQLVFFFFLIGCMFSFLAFTSPLKCLLQAQAMVHAHTQAHTHAHTHTRTRTVGLHNTCK